jgi:hypothetical protein
MGESRSNPMLYVRFTVMLARMQASAVSAATYESIDRLRMSERGWITPGERRFVG